MGTITSRTRKDNSTAYTAQIRINRDGKTVYQESQTFDRKQVLEILDKPGPFVIEPICSHLSDMPADEYKQRVRHAKVL